MLTQVRRWGAVSFDFEMLKRFAESSVQEVYSLQRLKHTCVFTW